MNNVNANRDEAGSSTASNPWRDVSADVIASGFQPKHILANRQFQCCPSVVATPGGRLYAAWISGGTMEPHIDNFGVVAYSDDHGATWVDPLLIVDHPCEDQVRINYMLLWLDTSGKLWAIWSQTIGRGFGENLHAFAIVIDDPDADIDKLKWTAPRRLFRGILHNKPTVLRSGEALFAVEDVVSRDKSYVYSSNDGGATIARRGVAISRSEHKYFHEAMIIELDDSRLWMLSRIEEGKDGGMEQSFSHDRGHTWTDYEYNLPPPLIGPGSRFHVRRLKSGRILLINHDNGASRSRLTAYLSEDDGKTWKHSALMDERADISYPDAFEDRDGDIYVAYDRGRDTDREILMAVFAEKDIIAETFAGARARKLLISKPSGR